ncbi:uncharacterized protein LOC135392901 [Ornithodoros turicata]|uniref:uncharacterized protein LOC135392901 n=1 Tax=Ornithodoros turicata TaxID=34597 RepID=UPI003138D31C
MEISSDVTENESSISAAPNQQHSTFDTSQGSDREEHAEFTGLEEFILDAKKMYVPIGGVLTHLLQKTDIYRNISKTTTTVSSDITTLKDFRDGTVYRKHQGTLAHASSVWTLYILLYTDELEIANPIGPRRGVHKLLVVYFCLLNLHPRFRSQLQNMYVVIIAKYKDIQEHGLHEVLKPMLDELNILYHDGVQYRQNDELCTARVFVQAFCGDNLSMNKLGGFSSSFAGGRVCRFCLAQAADLNRLTREDLCVVRTNAVHMEHLTAIATNPDNKKLYGVYSRSPLLDLGYFDVTLQLPPDVMHDLFEGSFAYVMHHVLKGLVDDSIFSVCDLSKVSSFSYGFHDNHNRPDELSSTFLSDHRCLKGTASQRWCLFRLLPLIFSSGIPEGNEHWDVYLTFRGIVDMLLAEEMPVDCVPYLEVRIQDFLKCFTTQYPSARIIPKIHFLIHYPRMMLALGPLRYYWCMRFEAKHQYFKALASRVKNFRNICKTLANRHQLMQCYYLHASSQDSGYKTSVPKSVASSSLQRCVQEIAREQEVWEVRCATLNAVTYRTEDIIVQKKGDIPDFSQISGVYIIAGKIYLLLNDLIVQGYRRHKCVYRVSRSNVYRIGLRGQEASHHMLDLYSGGEVMPMWELICKE